MAKYTADFETTTDENDCRVWAYAICEIGKPDNFIYGNSIGDFIKWCEKQKNATLYFHNLKFDGEYIFSYLLNHDYKCIKDKKDKESKTFTTLISDTGQFYSIEIYFTVDTNGPRKKIKKVTIYDSLKIINFSVEKIAKDFGLPISKLELDYHKKREIGHILDDEEVAYIRNDVEIMARALDFMFNENLTKMTIGSNALAVYKKSISNFSNYFPVLPYEIDQSCRQSYRGGWTYLNPLYKNQEVKRGIVIDKNSMYPSHMKYDDLPFGVPLYFNGEYEKDLCYPLYIQALSCSFELKKNKLPTIQMKNTPGFLNNEYLESSHGEILTLYLTSIDLELFKEHYEIKNLVYQGGYKFKKIKGLFSNYIDRWTNEKIKSKKEGNKVMYTISKLLLNSLYGKFGLNPNIRSKYPYLDEEGIIRYHLYDPEIRDSIYCPVACFITAYSRADIIRTSQKIRDYTLEKYGKDYYIYSDTDSVHCLYLTNEELTQFMKLDHFELGAWDVETEFKRGKFIRQKCYIEEDTDGNIKTTIAGLPKKLGKYVTFDNFTEGYSIKTTETDKEHKLRFKHVKGGVLLVDTDFTIK